MSQFTKRVDSDLNNGYFAGSWLSGGSLAGSWGTGRAFSGAEVYGAARFTSVNIPSGVTIDSAFLTLTDSQNQSSVTVNLNIKGIDEDNTADFTTDPDSRAKTTAAVNWNQTIAQSTNTTRTSPDLKTIIQEIIDRAGWVSGNALALISDDNGTANDKILRWISYGGDANKAAYLEINYTSPTTTSTTTSTSTSTSTSTTTTTTSTSTTTPGPELYGIKVYKL